jgi:Tfp pilus assembly protein PilN
VTPVFTINFRREVYQREIARSRARVMALGVWLTYFGIIAVIFGLYGLNCAVVANRTKIVERQAAAMKARRTDQVDWSNQTAQMAMVERGVADPRRWRERLERLSLVMPPDVRLTSVELNPGGASGAADGNRLVLSGTLRAGPDQDRMRSVASLVARLQRDSLLASQYHSIRLASTRVSDPAGANAEFVIECRP